MKQNISILMDGELSADEAELLLGRIKSQPGIRQEWLTYHLIGDALRQPDYVSCDMSIAVLERLHAEPTVLSPHSRRGTKSSLMAVSVAASIVAMVSLAWMLVQTDAGPPSRIAQQPGALRAASLPASEVINDYLLAHREFSPGTDVRGAYSYALAVASSQTVAGK